MKKYLLNCYNKILVRKTHDGKFNRFYSRYNEIDDLLIPVDIEKGETYYCFANNWSNISNVFSEKDSLLKDSIIDETNSVFKYLFWKIKYKKENK